MNAASRFGGEERARKAASRFGWPLVLLLSTACIPHVTVEDSPCPCPEGHFCCATLGVCLPDGGTCPQRQPTSSKKPCGSDLDCEASEICHAWTVEGEETLRGSTECRRRCSVSAPCGESERCLLVPHDGQPLASFAVMHACVAEETPTECAAFSCELCPEESVGGTFCGTANAVHGCMVGLHPTCGLTCQTVLVQDCGSPNCLQEEGGAWCDGDGPSNVCDLFPCSLCAGMAPFTVACAGSELVSCDAISYPAPECDTLCRKEVVASCSGGCSNDGSPHCL